VGDSGTYLRSSLRFAHAGSSILKATIGFLQYGLSMKVLFLDSNLFLQCRELHELPWNEIAPDEKEILLAISRPVQREIDKLKHDGNDRRAKRARKANSLWAPA
jgi:hypothetical protein